MPNVIDTKKLFGGRLGGSIGGRLVINDRINNLMNALSVSLEGSGIPGAIMNLAVGFAENNRKLLYGDSYYLKQGQFDYPMPVAKRP